MLNAHRLEFNRPTILVTNHPNTLIDALNSAGRIKMQAAFLANASMFNTPFKNWFFNTFYCIPIQRPQDTGGKPLKNDEAFARCDEFLGNNGCLFIAPEGGSEMVRRIRPLKTGTARIGFSAENKKDFQLGLSIQAVCTSYDYPNRFQSQMVVNVGSPIWFKDYEADYKADPVGTVRKVTAVLEEQMQGLIIDTIDEEEDQLIRHLEGIQQAEERLGSKKHFYRTKTLIQDLRAWKKKQGVTYQEFSTLVSGYKRAKEKLGISEYAINHLKKSLFFQAAFLLLFFPVFIYGWINNFLAFYTPFLIYKKLQADVTYEATVKILMGLFTIPVFYYLQYQLVNRFFVSPIPLIYLLSLPLFGYLAWKYKDFAMHTVSLFRLKTLNRKHPEKVNGLLKERGEIVKIVSKLIVQG